MGTKQVLTDDLILFGEWCAARHSLDYDALSDWFLLFDVFDRRANRFWSTPRRDMLAIVAGLQRVRTVLRRKITLEELIQRVDHERSQYRDGLVEGFVIRRESEDWCETRAKLVRAEFAQAIGVHWRNRPIEWNRLAFSEEPHILLKSSRSSQPPE